MDVGAGRVDGRTLRWRRLVAHVLRCGAVLAGLALPLFVAAAPAAGHGASAGPRPGAGEPRAVTLALSPGLSPFFTFDDAALGPQGFAVELAMLAAERAGLQLHFRRYGSLAEATAATRRGEVDALGFGSPGLGGLLPTRALLSVDMVLAVRRDIPDVSSANDFGGYRVAVEGASGAEALLRERFPAARWRSFDTPAAALKAVAAGDADIFVGHRPVVVHYLDSLLVANVQVRGEVPAGLSPLGISVSPSAPWLQETLDKALSSVSLREREALAQRWLPPSTLDAHSTAAVTLSAAEREWVDRQGRIRIGYDATFAPITEESELRRMGGLGADFMRLAAAKVGLAIEREEGGPFSEVYARSVAGEIDVLVGAARTSARRQHHDFVGPFLRVPTGIVTAVDDGRLVTRIEEIGRGRLALLADHFLLPRLRARHAALQLVTFATQAEVLEAVADGRADAGIGNLRVVNRLIDGGFTGRVRVTGTVADADSELYFAVRRDQPVLSQVLRKGLDAITPEESLAIERRWLAPVEVRGVEPLQVLRIVAVGTAVLLWLGTWAWLLRRGNRRLRAARQMEQDARLTAQASLVSRGRFLGYLAHELRGSLGAIASGAAMAKVDPIAAQRDRLLGAMQASAEGLQALLESTLQYEQQLDRPLALDPHPFALAREWPAMIAPFELTARAKGLLFSSRLDGADQLGGDPCLDGVRLRQVLNNLVGNAIKFTREGEVAVRARVHDGTLWFTVEDSGPGLSADDLATLFEPYAQGEHGRRLRQGAGLGLAIARQIVEAMGGRIEAGASACGGARFTVSLPLRGEAQATPGPMLATAG